MMLSHFKRTRPTHEPVRITPQDAQIAAMFDMSPAEWADLSPLARVDHREEFYRANGLASACVYVKPKHSHRTGPTSSWSANSSPHSKNSPLLLPRKKN